jgi:hypothetical protein
VADPARGAARADPAAVSGRGAALGLKDDETETDKTPWWLLLLRVAAIGAAILAFAGPVLNPTQREPGTGPLMLVIDGSWTDARDWPRRLERAEALAEEAGRDGRPLAVIRLTDPPLAPAFQAANAWGERIAALRPNPWAPDPAGWAAALPEGGFDTLWLSDGVDHAGRDALLSALEARGTVRVFESPRPVVACARRPLPMARSSCRPCACPRATPPRSRYRPAALTPPGPNANLPAWR